MPASPSLTASLFLSPPRCLTPSLPPCLQHRYHMLLVGALLVSRGPGGQSLGHSHMLELMQHLHNLTSATVSARGWGGATYGSLVARLRASLLDCCASALFAKPCTCTGWCVAGTAAQQRPVLGPQRLQTVDELLQLVELEHRLCQVSPAAAALLRCSLVLLCCPATLNTITL